MAALLVPNMFVGFVDSITRGLHLEQTEIPFYPVGADLNRKRQFILRDGTLGQACQSASSAPGVWRPFRVDGARVVDGGVVNNVPASVAWESGVDFVLASNIVPRDTEGKDKPIGEGRYSRYLPLAWRLDDTARSL